MPRLHVCSLARVEEVAAQTRAGALVTLLSPGTAHVRPAGLAAERHLVLDVSDIVTPQPGYVTPAAAHVSRLIDFVFAWDRQAPMLIHCYAGVSRSTAAAFIAACAIAPARPERQIALALRDASPTASPNLRLVALADDLLQRDGRMRDAIAAIGRGLECEEGEPFALGLG